MSSEEFLGIEVAAVSALSRRIRVALQYDQRGGAGRICRREQCRCHEPGVRRDQYRFTTPEFVEHGGDAVGPLFQRRQRPRRDGIGGSRARLVEEDESPQRCHRLDPPLKRRQLRKKLTGGEPVRDDHDVPGTRGRRAIGDTQVPIHRIARLREHAGSLSREAGPAVRVGLHFCCSQASFTRVLSQSVTLLIDEQISDRASAVVGVLGVRSICSEPGTSGELRESVQARQLR